MNRAPLFYWLTGGLIAVVLLGAAFYFDEPVRQFIAQRQSRNVKIFMRNVSRLGDWTEHFAVGIGLLGVAWWRRNKKWTRVFLAMLVALAFAGAGARVLKIVAGRARPSVQTEQAWNGIKFTSRYHAFPSGHVAASVAFFAALAVANWRIGLLCLPIPVLIGLSRMYVAAHYLSDVVCAALLGLVCGVITAHFLLRECNNTSAVSTRG